MQWPWNKPTAALVNTKGVCGIRFFHDGISLAHVTRTIDKKPILAQCEFKYCQSDQRKIILERMVKKYNLEDTPCVWVIPHGTYQLISVERLPVPAEELSAAIRWHIKDRLNFPISDASVDYFMLPHQGNNQKEQIIYAVAAKKSYLSSHIDIIHNSRLQLKIIDVPDLVYCNIAKLYDTQQGIAVLGVRKNEAIVAMLQKNQLFALRRLELGTSQSLEENSSLEAKLMHDVQRSIDYYEMELGQPPIDKLLVAPPYGELLPLLRARLPYTVEGIDLSKLLTANMELNEELQIRSADAVGGALRQEENNASAD